MSNKLIEFREKIKEDLTFFFPEYNGIKGFLGDGDIFFVSQKPSTGTFPSAKDKLFYRLLKKYGLENAHLTDLIKTRGKTIGKMSKDELELNWSIFKKEIELLKPKLLVAVGWDVYRNLKEKIDSIKIVRITHYALRYGKQKEIEKKIENDIKKVKGQFKSKIREK